MLRLNGLTEYWKGLSGRIWNVEDDCTACDILMQKNIAARRTAIFFIPKYSYFVRPATAALAGVA